MRSRIAQILRFCSNDEFNLRQLIRFVATPDTCLPCLLLLLHHHRRHLHTSLLPLPSPRSRRSLAASDSLRSKTDYFADLCAFPCLALLMNHISSRPLVAWITEAALSLSLFGLPPLWPSGVCPPFPFFSVSIISCLPHTPLSNEENLCD